MNTTATAVTAAFATLHDPKSLQVNNLGEVWMTGWDRRGLLTTHKLGTSPATVVLASIIGANLAPGVYPAF
jgi:hypothetical protein